MRHPDDAELLELELDGPGGEWADHVRACPDCRERVMALREDLARLGGLDGATLDLPAPPLPRARGVGRTVLLRTAAAAALVVLGGAATSRWLEDRRVQVVAYVAPAPRVHGLGRVACPVGDLAVMLDTLRSGD